MDMADIHKLSPASREAYIRAERFYGSDGWIELKEWLEEQKLIAERTAAYAATWEQNRGNIAIAMFIDQLLAREDLLFQQFEEEVETVRVDEESSDAGDLFV